jgi:hypothetical protein
MHHARGQPFPRSRSTIRRLATDLRLSRPALPDLQGAELEGKLAEFATGIEVVVISGDPEAKEMVEETGLTAPMGHDLTVAADRHPAVGEGTAPSPNPACSDQP